jgi:hypothetical protein
MKKISKTRLTVVLFIVTFLSTSNSNADIATTSTGLDQIVDIILTDARLQKKISMEDIYEGAVAADMMNKIIIKAIIDNGLANDKKISTADTRELNDYIFHNYRDDWVVFHGDDEDGEETGFHLVQNDGAKTKLLGKNAINRVADGIYHLGFETHRKNRLLNEDGNKNVTFKKVGLWLNSLLAQDLKRNSLKNRKIKEVIGTTRTGLDQIIDIIYTDVGLQKRISTGDIRKGSAATDGLNHIILEAIIVTDVANDGNINANDARLLNKYIVANHSEIWSELHGDDEATGEETGFHLVQSDGAKTKLFGKNALNRVADAIYHLGFPTTLKNRLLNEDGNKNATFKKVALWLNNLLQDDFNKIQRFKKP